MPDRKGLSQRAVNTQKGNCFAENKLALGSGVEEKVSSLDNEERKKGEKKGRKVCREKGTDFLASIVIE